MSEYRTGDSPINDEQEKVMNEAEDIVNDVLNPPQENEEGQEKEAPQAERPAHENPLQDIETAVLLVVNSQGNVLPVVQIENLDMKRIATPREVYRLCLDAADQLSSVSLLGEMTQIYSTIAKEQAKLIATNMASLLIQVQKNKSAGDSQ
mgnify:CR=1 FL=1|jgi:hypothetical protein